MPAPGPAQDLLFVVFRQQEGLLDHVLGNLAAAAKHGIIPVMDIEIELDATTMRKLAQLAKINDITVEEEASRLIQEALDKAGLHRLG